MARTRRLARRCRRRSRGGITLERPPRADFGDYSTNAALLLAPRLRRPPREVAERLGGALAQEARRRARALRGGRAGIRQPAPRRRLAAATHWPGCSPPGASFGAGGAARAGEHGDGRVRLGQPDRADARRPRAQRRLRRRAGADAGIPRRARVARVLRQRRGHAGAHVRRLGAGDRARRAAARGWLPGRVRGRAGGAPGRRRRRRGGRARPRGGRAR